MKLNNLLSIRSLEDVPAVPTIKPMRSTTKKIDKSLLNQIELIHYSTNLCLFSSRILRNEITVPNRDGTLNRTAKEISTLRTLLLRDDYYMYATYTKQDTKKFFKSVGLKPKHIKH